MFVSVRYFDQHMFVRNKVKSEIHTSTLDPFNCWKVK